MFRDMKLKKVGAWPQQPQSSQNSSHQSGYNPANYGQPVGANYGQPVGVNNGQPIGANYGQPVGAINTQPVDANYGQPVGANYGQPVGAINAQPFGANTGQPFNAQPYPANVVVFTRNTGMARNTRIRRLVQCPKCGQLGAGRSSYPMHALLLAVIFFPTGVICCLMMEERKCSNCNEKLQGTSIF